MTRMSVAATVAREQPTGVQLFAIRRIDSRGSMVSLEGVANRQQTYPTARPAPDRPDAHYEAFREDVTGARSLRLLRSDDHFTSGMPMMPGASGVIYDPPPPYSPPGHAPEYLAPSEPPPYALACRMDSPPPYTPPSVDWYLREGYPRTDV